MRHTVGYDRWETDQEFAILESIHKDLRLYINFFQPSFKLIAKDRIGNKTIKRYDTVKTRLMNLYLQFNPAELRRSIDQKTAKLWRISR